MAEGAIEGEASMYELPFAYAVDFAFSRFNVEWLAPILADSGTDPWKPRQPKQWDERLFRTTGVCRNSHRPAHLRHPRQTATAHPMRRSPVAMLAPVTCSIATSRG